MRILNENQVNVELLWGSLVGESRGDYTHFLTLAAPEGNRRQSRGSLEHRLKTTELSAFQLKHFTL